MSPAEFGDTGVCRLLGCQIHTGGQPTIIGTEREIDFWVTCSSLTKYVVRVDTRTTALKTHRVVRLTLGTKAQDKRIRLVRPTKIDPTPPPVSVSPGVGADLAWDDFRANVTAATHECQLDALASSFYRGVIRRHLLLGAFLIP